MNLADKIGHPDIVRLVGNCADVLGVEAYLVGGYVRDTIIGRPTKDIDIVCVGSGIELAKAVTEVLPKKQFSFSYFKNFGTAQIVFDHLELQFVGARRESYRNESRKPLVEDGTLADDQNRRDFTINALAIKINKIGFGNLIDPFNGLLDLKQHIIRTPLEPEITFSDDPLRMLRAIRFATQLDFDIEPVTIKGLMTSADRLKIISAERIIDELNKIIMSDRPAYGFKLLYSTHLLQQFFPEMVNLAGVQILDGKGHKDNFYHTLAVLENVIKLGADLWLRWAAILHDIAKPHTKRFHPKIGWTFHGHEEKGARMVNGIFRRLKLPMGANMKKVENLVRLHLRPIALVDDNVTDSAVRRLLFDAGDDIDDLMKLCRADITSKNPNKVKKYLDNFDWVERRMVEVEQSDALRNFQPVITGELIMEMFAIEPSRLVGTIKTEVREAILDGKIKNNLDDCIPFVIEIGKNLGLNPVRTDFGF